MNDLINNDVSLRFFTQEDKSRLAALANNINVSVNLRDGFPHPYTIGDAEKFIDSCILQVPTTVFAITYKGVYVGNVSLQKGTDVYAKSAELGYFIGEEYWNKGIMTKAVKLMCEYGFANLDIVRIHAGVFEYNIASQTVLAKNGFQQEGIFKNAIYKNGGIYDEIRFALTLK